MSKKVFGLTGYPLGHSLSPFIHCELMKLRGIDGNYGLYETESGTLDKFCEKALLNFDGFNVTIPYKTDIIPLLDSLGEKAELIGAVNTVHIENGISKGYNTDCIGFLRSLEYADIETGKNVLICGCGGAGRMFAFECALSGADVTFAVRESGFKKAQSIKNEMETKLNKTADIVNYESVDGDYDLIINATPVGMYPKTDFSPLTLETVKRAKAVFDAVYNPSRTLLLRYADESGIKYLNGLPMLVWQAAAAQEIWNGVKYVKDEIDTIIGLTEKELEKR